MIPKKLYDIMKQTKMDKVAEEFWQEIEKLASEKEVTVEYYLAEFY